MFIGLPVTIVSDILPKEITDEFGGYVRREIVMVVWDGRGLRLVSRRHTSIFMWCDCVMDHDKYEVCCLPRPQTRARKSLCNLRSLKLPFHSLYRQMEGSFWNYLERNFVNGYKGIFRQKFGTFYAEVEVLGKLVSKERASSNHVQKFWSHFRQISVNKNAHTRPFISPQIFVYTFN